MMSYQIFSVHLSMYIIRLKLYFCRVLKERDIWLYDIISCNVDNVKNDLYYCHIVVVSYYCLIKVGAISITMTIKM